MGSWLEVEHDWPMVPSLWIATMLITHHETQKYKQGEILWGPVAIQVREMVDCLNMECGTGYAMTYVSGKCQQRLLMDSLLH